MLIHSSTPSSYLTAFVKGKLVHGTHDKFYQATLINARISIKETGVSRFDLLRGISDPNDFLLIEVYKNKDAPDEHKTTAHYKEWRVTVEDIMAEPRAATKYSHLYPTATHLDTSEQSGLEDKEHYQEHHPWMHPPLQQTSASVKGGLLARMVDVTVSKDNVNAFINASFLFCRACTNEPTVHRVELMVNTANNHAADKSNFQLVLMLNQTRSSLNTLYEEWLSGIQPFLASQQVGGPSSLCVSEYTTLFPSPMYHHQHGALTHKGEGADFLQSCDPACTWNGHCGLSTTNTAIGMFGFQGPKILMGRGIAAKAIRDTLSTVKATCPLIVMGSGGLERNGALLSDAFDPLCTDEGLMTASYDPSAHTISVSGEPTVEDALRITAFAIAEGCDSVLAVGGGSVLDVGKAVAALARNSHRDIFDFLEVIGKGIPIENDPLPFIAVPTTSGTGSEATKNAVLKSVKHGLKVSIRHDKMFPVAAILDPLLTLSCPPSVTAHVGMDTLCQCLEPFLCCVPNPFVDALCKEGIMRSARSLRNAVADGAVNIEAREDMAVASVMSGLSLANAKLGVVHGFAAVLGGRFESAPHGALCAVLLPYVFEVNAKCLQERAGLSDNHSNNASNFLQDPDRLNALIRLARFQEAARMLTGNLNASIEDGVMWLHALMKDINIPPLRLLCPELARIAGIGSSGEVNSQDQLELRSIVQATMNASSSKGNPITLSLEHLTEILLRAL